MHICHILINVELRYTDSATKHGVTPATIEHIGHTLQPKAIVAFHAMPMRWGKK